jgi:hypothetical protein
MSLRGILLPLALCLVAATLTSTAYAGPTIFVGAAEDAARSLDAADAKAKMDLARLAGLDAIRLSAIWTPGKTKLEGDALVGFQNAVAAADLDGIRVIVSVYQSGGRATPRTARAQAQFAQFAASIGRANPSVRDFVIGNEPNLNRFWMPQFGPGGRDVAASAYEALLARTSDALKSVSKSIDVAGGALSPRGSDNPRLSRPTHSPTAFIRDLGAVYRHSHRTRPLMDTFAFHPYLESSKVSPAVAHPRSTTIALADYDKLVRLLGSAFAGTPQRGRRLPILYDEFGVQTRIPAAKKVAYTDFYVASARDAVSEAVQAAYYRRALALAACQRTVKGFLIFHVSDESDLDRWQSGLYYADNTPKTSLGPVKRAIEQLHAGRLARCQK